ncbi:hypothetical protein GA0074695_5123 [Micromonospora viridifaciens]|uniref:Uncharacterized protein n=1 Tax=Micromonospora viridifaciens TaxID=1881 RepID=A0A1C4Z5K1_MICVI|nr:hypothetical protein GA0074695_5123 [Micromonospora viridifaciens]
MRELLRFMNPASARAPEEYKSVVSRDLPQYTYFTHFLAFRRVAGSTTAKVSGHGLSSTRHSAGRGGRSRHYSGLTDLHVSHSCGSAGPIGRSGPERRVEDQYACDRCGQNVGVVNDAHRAGPQDDVVAAGEDHCCCRRSVPHRGAIRCAGRHPKEEEHKNSSRTAEIDQHSPKYGVDIGRTALLVDDNELFVGTKVPAALAGHHRDAGDRSAAQSKRPFVRQRPPLQPLGKSRLVAERVHRHSATDDRRRVSVECADPKKRYEGEQGGNREDCSGRASDATGGDPWGTAVPQNTHGDISAEP